MRTSHHPKPAASPAAEQSSGLGPSCGRTAASSGRSSAPSRPLTRPVSPSRRHGPLRRLQRPKQLRATVDAELHTPSPRPTHAIPAPPKVVFYNRRYVH